SELWQDVCVGGDGSVTIHCRCVARGSRQASVPRSVDPSEVCVHGMSRQPPIWACI
ncbi:hypothetical protein SARC_18245, partial [Sphaeroforma arctica JP610]